MLLRLLASRNVASKRWVYEQYNQMVRTNNLVLGKADGAIVLLKESVKALSIKSDCNS